MPPGLAVTASAHPALVSAAPSPGTTTTSAPIFLIPNGTFVVELVLFIIVLGIVAKFILPPITGATEERARKVRNALQASDDGRVEADRLVSERHETLDGARAEARSRLEQAAAEVDALLTTARDEGQAEHDRLLAAAVPQIEAERHEVEEALLGKMTELVVAAATQVVGVPLDAAKHRKVIDDAVTRATSGARGSGGA